MSVAEHLNKDNLHHAYLIEGERENAVKEITNRLEQFGCKVIANPDFIHLYFDILKIEDAFNLREMASKKSFAGGKKIFLICLNSITRDAQGALLKVFEEPGENTHFFVVLPDSSALFPTLRSRFYPIYADAGSDFKKEAEKFIAMPPRERVAFLNEFLKEKEAEAAEGEFKLDDSVRTKAQRFLNALEAALWPLSRQKILSDSRHAFPYLSHIFEVRQYLRQAGSSVKTLLEALALYIPNF